MVYKVHHARSGGVLHGARPGWLTEHHIRHEEISIINLGQYTLWAHYRRINFQQGGVSIYIYT
jgi:hypothetical protein